ncbi:MAG: hypothetical protein HY590_00290 [Candidatus Omnitrophica bacterium]|nr:hypothetical protein [Candidatus Omnitrophota bacterium]
MTPEKRFRGIRKELILLGVFLLLALIMIILLVSPRFHKGRPFETVPEQEAAFRLYPPLPKEMTEAPSEAPGPEVEVEIVPQSILVDNFDLGATSGIFTERFNSLGSYQGSWAHRPSYSLLSKSDTVRRGEKGRGLAIDYYKDGGWCGYYNLLAGIDVSGLNTLSFWVKGEKGGEVFDIGLADQRMQDLGIDAVYFGSVNNFLPKGVTTEWQEVKLPMTKLAAEMNLSEMGSFVLWFRYEGRGRIYLEDVLFKNDPEVERILLENAPRALRDPLHPRSLWVWNIDPAQNLKARKELFELCDRTGIQNLYLYIGEFSEKEDPKYAEHLEGFLREAHKRKLRIEALTGNPIWQFEENHAVALQWIRAFLEFNQKRPVEARMDGISLDIEPYLDQAWNENREKVKASFLSLLKKIRALLGEYPDQKFRFGVVAPIFYDAEGPEFEKSIFEAVDTIALMDYYDTVREIGGNAVSHLQLAEAMGKKVSIGVETQDLVAMKQGGRRNTFFEEGWEGMEEVLKEVAQGVEAYSSFEGFSIHHYSSYKNLQKSRNVPTKERKIFYTVDAMQVSKPVTTDGDLFEWEELIQAPTVEEKENVVYGQGAWRGKKDLSFKASVRWDEGALYLAVAVFDDRLAQEKVGEDLWEGDHVEIWLDMDLEGDYTEAVNSDDDFQFGLSPGNFGTLKPELYLWTPPLDKTLLLEATVAAKKIERGYTLEARIPTKILFATAKKGSDTRLVKGRKFGISVDVSDTDDARAPQKCLISTSTNRIWGDPTTFGTLELK